MTKMKKKYECSLHEHPVKQLLNSLHKDAARENIKLIRFGLLTFFDTVLKRKPSMIRQAQRMKDLHLPISPAQGRLLYVLARSINARTIIEFGSSFGISTIYLGTAVKDNGRGKVYGTEIEPNKVIIAAKNIRTAGLERFVEIFKGDALITLKKVIKPVDMVFLDGLKELYLPVLKILKPNIKKGGIVVADDILLFKKTLKPYVEYMKNPANGFSSATIHEKDGFMLSYKL